MDSDNKSYLIKRNSIFTNSKVIKKFNSSKKGYSDIRIDHRNYFPLSNKLKKGDILYVAETGGGIYAKGKVLEEPKEEVFDNIEQVLDFCQNRNRPAYWMPQIINFHEKLKAKSNTKLRFIEYFIEQELLDMVIPFNGPLKEYKKGRNTFIELKERDLLFLKNPDYRLDKLTTLNPKIPSDLRLKVYLFMNKKYSIGHMVDIDHFVPKSVGGPGNIIENLVPIGLSLNRYKSDSIPRGFFQIARDEFPEMKKSIDKILKDTSLFIKNSKFSNSKEIATKITALINKKDIKDSRNFYFKVLSSFHNDYAMLIDEYNLNENL
ncbi:hypothetical protein [Lutimonas vermicola]|uniref:HNH endonuclease n=1 Tax=Lutimonas vermicola TaxID=414288 RepID=A0ABU9KXD1_9FLAO